jgi:glycosyltransferase involved in cell wall biosynthesis
VKIAVYTICKNEELFIDRWIASCANADEIIVVDTGSTDKTLNKLQKYTNIRVHNISINPWRFEDARNASLAAVSNDIDVCICLDMDEVLVKGWREIVEKSFTEQTTRLRYNYIWSWEGPVPGVTPGVTYHADKIHARHGFRWVNPVHEVLVYDPRLGPETPTFIPDTLIKHYPDNTKSRADYLPLMALAVTERPRDDRMVHYYGRELFFSRQYDSAIEQIKKHVQMPEAIWSSERAASYRYMGDCYWGLGNYDAALDQFMTATNLVPNEREAWVSLAQAYRALGDPQQCKAACEKALAITEKPNTYINWPTAWSDWPNQMLQEAETKLLTIV